MKGRLDFEKDVFYRLWLSPKNINLAHINADHVEACRLAGRSVNDVVQAILFGESLRELAHAGG